MTYPDFVEKKISEIEERFKVSRQEIIQKYEEIMNSQLMQNDTSFKEEEDKHKYATKVVFVKFASRPKTTDIVAVPFGMSEIRLIKATGKPMSKIYARLKSNEGSGTWKNKIIMLKDAACEQINNIDLLHAYGVKLSVGKDIMFGTQDTKFAQGKPLPSIDPYKFYVKDVGVKPVTLEEAPFNLSKKKDKYVDEMDLRLIRAVVGRQNKGTRQDGTEFGVYNITDGTVPEDYTTSDGKLVSAIMTCWTPPRLMKYDSESECYFIGTLAQNKEEETEMQCIAVIPIHAIPIEEGGGS